MKTNLPACHIIVMVYDQPSHHWSNEPHSVSQGIYDSHQSASEVIRNIQHGALFPGVDDTIATHSTNNCHHRHSRVTPGKGGT